MTDDSDQEFARFLEEDDDSTSMSASFQYDTRAAPAAATTSSHAGKKNEKSGSASAVTAAAAALLASSKLLSASGAAGRSQALTDKKSKKKATKDKSSSSSKAKIKKSAARADYGGDDDDDDEGPPPSYSASRRASLDVDPYAFDLDSSFHLQSDGSDSERTQATKSKSKTKSKAADSKSRDTKKKSKKPESAKRESKPVLSLEDRVAQILKRTGSSNVPPAPVIEERASRESSAAASDDNEGDANALASVVAATKRETSDADSSEVDAKKLSMSDSLGMESADFEVGAHAKRQLERSRLSLASSLNSDKFAVNVDALEESELHMANPRYATPSEPLVSTRYDTSDGEPDATDDYEDEGFELDQTTAGDVDLAPLSVHSESYLSKDSGGANTDTDTPFVSQFEKMKELFSVDSSLDPVVLGASEGLAAADARGNNGAAIEASAAEGYEAAAATDDNFGYEDEEFENDEAGECTDEQTAVEPSDAAVSPTAKADTQESASTADAVNSLVSELPSWYLRPLPVESVTTGLEPPASNALPVQPDIETAAAADIGVDDNSHARHEHTDDNASRERESGAGVDTGRARMLESPPMSPPPPPPPDDDDEPDPNDLHAFTLGERAMSQCYDDHSSTAAAAAEAATRDHHTIAAQPQSQQDRAVSMPVSAAIDRFQHLQSYVASLRIITGPPSHQQQQQQQQREATDRSDDKAIARHQKQRRSHAVAADTDTALAAATPVWSLPPPIDLEQASMEMDAFLRRSRRLQHERQQLRASATRETELALRLQHAQRQILQLKRHIQGSDGDDDDGDDDDASVDDSDALGTAAAAHPGSASDDHADDRDSDTGVQFVKSPAARASRSHQLRRRRDGPAHTISAAEYATLQKEMQTQETLIQAFQRENEQLMRQLKRLQHGAQMDVLAENEQLRKQVRELRDALESQQDRPADYAADGSSSGGVGAAQYRLAVEARLHAEAHVLALEDELVAVRSAHQARENELKLALDRVKKAKVELECRYEGVDLAKLANETQHVRTLEHDLARVRTESQHALAALQKKLDWYVENQRLLDAQDDELRRLKSDVERLTAELQHHAQHDASTTGGAGAGATGKSPGKSPKHPHHRSPADIRRISELESRVSEMEEAMRKRHPDSLVNLILATRRAEDESARASMVAAHEAQLRAHEQELEQLQTAHETKLQSFRQQQEKLVLLFQKRIREQDRQLQKQKAHPGASSNKRRTTASGDRLNGGVGTAASAADDDEVKRVRKFYTDKIKELERKWDAKVRALKKQSGGASGDTGSVSAQTSAALVGLSHTDTTTIIANLQRQLREKNATIAELSAHSLRHPVEAAEMLTATTTKRLDSDRDGDERSGESRDDMHSETPSRELRARLHNVEAQLAASEDARAHLVQTLSTLQTFAVESPSPLPRTAQPPAHSPEHEDSHTTAAAAREHLETARQQAIAHTQEQLRATFCVELNALRAAHSAELARANETIAVLERQVREQTRALETQASSHAQEREHLSEQLRAAEQQSRAAQACVDSVSVLEHEVAHLREQLAVPRTPSMLQYRSLEMKIETLSQKHVLREAELKVLLARATQSSELEKRELERVHQSAIAAKNVEIRHFKKQLDVILHELELLRQPQAP